MVKILFVCHGNICRSPMAEFVMKDMVKRAGMEDAFCIASAATSAEELGNPVHYGTRAKLREAGISCAGKTARLVARKDYDAYDWIIGMDRANLRSLHRLFGGDPDGKVHLLMEYAGENREVADPWYTGDFDATYDDVVAGCAALLNWLLEDGR